MLFTQVFRVLSYEGPYFRIHFQAQAQFLCQRTTVYSIFIQILYEMCLLKKLKHPKIKVSGIQTKYLGHHGCDKIGQKDENHTTWCLVAIHILIVKNFIEKSVSY